MRSFNFMITLILGLVSFTAAFPDFHFFEAREAGEKNGTSKEKNGTKMNSVKKQCKAMARLTMLTDLANNQTKMDALVSKGKLNDTELTALKAKAAEAGTKLQALTANTTLVGECAVVNAHTKSLRQCKKMKTLTKLTELASNQTAMDALIAKKKLNDTQATELKDNIKSVQIQLDELKSNTTLTDICAKETSQKGNSGSGADSTSASSGSQAAAAESKNGASAIGLENVSFAFLPIIAAIFTLLL